MNGTPWKCLLVLLCVFAPWRGALLNAAEPWSTYRGNSQRTANTDGLAGTAAPKVLWVHASKEHFIASPLPVGDRIYLGGLGGFNISTFYALAADPKEPQRIVWSKSTPFLKLPIVSTPAVADGKLI